MSGDKQARIIGVTVAHPRHSFNLNAASQAMSEINTEILPDGEDARQRAADVLRAGGLVAFPTETVYGLGADARNDRAVAGIYEAKGRPSFNPLIVHVSTLEAAQKLVEWTPQAEALARAFWPGPLTLVLKRKADARVSRLVSAGLDTLAIRIPAHPTARGVLAAFDGPVAAPSANRSGQISPTRAVHVAESLSGRIDLVLDGGRCEVGLESTILGLSGKPTLLRPGSITSGQLAAALGQPVLERRDTEAISAPGQLVSHYAPTAQVRLNATDWRDGEARLGFGDTDCDLNLSPTGDLVEAASNLFEFLHQLDASEAKTIAVAPIPHEGLGLAINDRLSRAAAPRGI